MTEPIRFSTRFNECIGRELEWRVADFFGRNHRLLDQADVLAAMDWRGFGSAVARTASDEWSFTRGGLLSLRAEVRNNRTGGPALSIKGGLRSGTLRTPDGATYTWKRVGLFRLRIELFDQVCSLLLTAGARLPFARKRGYVVIHPTAAQLRLLPLLTVALWYVVFRNVRRRARHGG